jgi:general secretion pathway protein G
MGKFLRPAAHKPGFTLIELLVVLAIVATLAALVAPRYFQSVDRATEAVLSENLRITRDAIDKFYGDQGRYPETLDELVEKRYLRSPPTDPTSDPPLPWAIIAPPEGERGAVYDLKSTSPGQTRDGRALNTL